MKLKFISQLVAVLFPLLLISNQLFGYNPTDSLDENTNESPRFQQQPGLALAASKIFFTSKKYSISGFGEFNYVPIQGEVNTEVGDLELYYTGLYRYSTFLGYKLTDKLIWNSELLIEFLHYKNQDTDYEIVIEAFLDYSFKDYLKARFGFFPLTIGYINSNDEPVMYYSVNRYDVERLIIPSSWVEFGAMLYGNLSENLSYTLGITQGLNAKNFLSGTWIRQGRETRLDIPKSITINPQITYTGLDNLTFSLSGYWGNSGQGETIINENGEETNINANIKLLATYAKYETANLRFVTVGTIGSLSDTEQLFALNHIQSGKGEVMGSQVYGYLFELGYDILPLVWSQRDYKNANWFADARNMKLPFFIRYERLNTHYKVNESLKLFPRVENDLSIWTFGINFNTNDNIVFKANYQHRRNLYGKVLNPIRNIFETGIGFIF